uniref:Uncharacterized protein n=1 Tax=Romanomermis culicivorax TaxID=13658 RepID=A0A915I4P2_ROMCU
MSLTHMATRSQPIEYASKNFLALTILHRYHADIGISQNKSWRKHSKRCETSTPSRSSSTTTSAPASLNFLSSSDSRTAWQASPIFLATVTPLPAARPEALTTKALYEELQMKKIKLIILMWF